MKLQKLVFVLLVIIFFLFPLIIFGNSGTILTVQGKAWLSKNNSTWQQLKQGTQINFGDQLRTETQSNVGILNPDGSLKRVGASMKIVYRPDQKTEEKGFFALLIDLFSSEDRTRIGGSRGEGDEVICPNNIQWIKFLQKSSITQTELKDILAFTISVVNQKRQLSLCPY